MNTGILGVGGPRIIEANEYRDGEELAYVERTTEFSDTGTTEASATAIVTAPEIVLDGNTIILVEFFAPHWQHSTAGAGVFVNLFDNSIDQGQLLRMSQDAGGGGNRMACRASRRFTPAAGAHVYSANGWNDTGATLTITAGAGGAGVLMPAYLQITKVRRTRS